ncbi:MAG: von Willebrand factor type A domain-containing protein [Chloroflexota bacterium]
MNKKSFLPVVVILLALSLTLSACGLFSANQGGNQNNDPNQPEEQEKNFLGIVGDLVSGSDAAEISNNGSPGYPETIGESGLEIAPSVGAGSERSYSGQVESGDSPPDYEPYPTPPPTRPADPPGDMFFEDYGVNPFIDTEDDFLSTFAADVDTGSYTLARSYLNQGILPPEDAIRVEEFVNFFPQGYKSPSARDTFSIQIDGAPTPFTESERYQVIRVGVQGYQIPASERKDAALTFVIDVSGSMSNGDRLGIVQDALALLVGQLRSSDTVAIVAYTDTAWVVLEPTSARHEEEIIDAIYSLYPMASTNAEAGLIQGYRLASSAYLARGINRVILCSDGVANVGNTGPGSIWESIEDYASEGITLTSIGVGMGNYNDELMEQLADHGEGFYAYVDTHEEAERLFVHDLVSTLQVIAMDAKIQVEFNEDVVSRYRLIGFENRAVADEDFRNNKVDAAEIGAGHSVTALYEIKLHAGAHGEIATVHLRWENPDTHRVEEISETFTTREMEDSFRLADEYFQMDVLVAEFAEILRESYWADGSEFEDVLEYADRLADHLELADFYEFIELVKIASGRGW